MHVLIEGKASDPFFYGSILEETIPQNTEVYRLLKAHELPSESGGKQALLKFYTYLRNRKGLVSDFKGKKTGIIFFLDKDMDDILRKKVRSSSVCYTEYYSVENYIFVYGDIARGIAIASSMEIAEVRKGLGIEKLWRQSVAIKWIEWMKICIFALLHDIDCGCGFGTFSRINTPVDAPVNSVEHSKLLAIMQEKSSLNPQEFAVEMDRIGLTIKEKIDSFNHDVYFNGKWYVPFVENTIKIIAKDKPYESAGIRQRIKSSVLSTLDFKEQWAERFKITIKNIIAKLD